MKTEPAPDRVEYFNRVWRREQPARTIQRRYVTGYLEPWIIPKRAFEVSVFVYSDGQLVFSQSILIRGLGANSQMMASPLGVVLS